MDGPRQGSSSKKGMIEAGSSSSRSLNPAQEGPLSLHIDDSTETSKALPWSASESLLLLMAEFETGLVADLQSQNLSAGPHLSSSTAGAILTDFVLNFQEQIPSLPSLLETYK
ncbi:hypothetical protein LIER_23104 [Lithospermum erythrorhizon]|uniref:Uncharacterized protein n=1 Tax=Lithospermum erythrorhizon TaxID=34254 RepID=A0AAV3QXS2_LITER